MDQSFLELLAIDSFALERIQNNRREISQKHWLTTVDGTSAGTPFAQKLHDAPQRQEKQRVGFAGANGKETGMK